MNIFASSYNPLESAQALDDKRVVKMVLESAQLLSTAMNETGLPGPYKTTHKNHPCSIWVRENRQNYLWLYSHFYSLCGEYQKRFHKQHKCFDYIDVFTYDLSKLNEDYITQFANCTIYKEETDVTKAYKMYLNYKWANDKRPPKWTNTRMPEWACFTPAMKVLYGK